MFGVRHVELTALKAIGMWIEDSGWAVALVQSGIASSGTPDSFLKASHVSKTRLAHQIMASVLKILMVTSYDTSKNINVAETNRALKQYCLSQGWDFIDHQNISFRHLDQGGMHLTPEGNRLFARNLIAHAKQG